VIDDKTPDESSQAVTEAARGAPGVRRLLAFLNPAAPADALARAQRASDWAERAAIAIHPNTPEDVLARLTEDGNTYVRALARESLASRGQ
jgi:hypothetical protein